MPTICMPPATGIPGAPGPPNWEQAPGANLPDSLNRRLDDPRWHGAGGTGWGAPAIGPAGPSPLGNTTGLPVVFRALSSGPAGAEQLHLLWWVRADTSHDATDQLIVGFEAEQRAGEATRRAWAFTVLPFGSTPPTGSAAPLKVPLSRMGAFERVNGAWTQRPVPAWLNSVWAWATPGMEWAIAMRVPRIAAGAVDVGLILADPFKFWWELQVVSGGAIAYGPHWPDTVGYFASGLTDPAGWGVAHVGADASCTGVSVEWSDIGSAHPDGAHFISLAGANVLHVDPGNTGPAVPANTMLATFSIANWGSSSNWLAIVPDGAPSPQIPDTAGIPAGTSGVPVHGHIQFNWTVPPALAQEFTNGTRDEHQCMLVQLTGAATFVRDSAFRNMWFVPASEFSTEAEVSIKGLAPIAGGGKRRTYLMLSLTNMPEILDGPRPERPRDPDDGEKPGEPELPDINLAAKGGDEPDDPDDAFRYEPTYVVQVFHDTGRRRTVGGRQLREVEPAPNFGYVVDHQGALSGWDAELSGGGLARIAENLWLVRIPEDGAVKVRTRIVARERPLTWWERLLRWLLKLLRRLWFKLRRLLLR